MAKTKNKRAEKARRQRQRRKAGEAIRSVGAAGNLRRATVELNGKSYTGVCDEPGQEMFRRLIDELRSVTQQRDLYRERLAAAQAAGEPWQPLVPIDRLADFNGNVDDVTEAVRTVWQNEKYLVQEAPEEPGRPVEEGGCGPMIHLSIKRNDGQALIDWRDLQLIKNQLIGEEGEAIQIFPGENRLVDTANQFHLWCFPCFRFPFGFDTRLVSDQQLGGTSQRQWSEEDQPDDLTRFTEEERAAIQEAFRDREGHRRVPPGE